MYSEYRGREEPRLAILRAKDEYTSVLPTQQLIRTVLAVLPDKGNQIWLCHLAWPIANTIIEYLQEGRYTQAIRRRWQRPDDLRG